MYRTTILPAVLQLCETYQHAGAMVVEDSVLLRQNVTYSDVATEIQQRQAPAGVWGTAIAGRNQTPRATLGVDGGEAKVCG